MKITAGSVSCNTVSCGIVPSSHSSGCPVYPRYGEECTETCDRGWYKRCVRPDHNCAGILSAKIICQHDGTYSGSLNCTERQDISWLLGGKGDSCAKVCSDADRGCLDGDWASDEASLRAALVAGGLDAATLCPSGFGGNKSGTEPSVFRGKCTVPNDPADLISHCLSSSSNTRRLCMCV